MHPTESKPGYLTTEFWLVLVGNVVLYVCQALNAVELKPPWPQVISAATIIAYALARGQAKAGIPAVVEDPYDPSAIDDVPEDALTDDDEPLIESVEDGETLPVAKTPKKAAKRSTRKKA